MANPLMTVMLNNILEKEGIKTIKAQAKVSSGCNVNLKKEQESLLLNSVFKTKTSSAEKDTYYGTAQKNKMVTLEELRGPKTDKAMDNIEAKKAAAEKTMVTLASIGKLRK